MEGRREREREFNNKFANFYTKLLFSGIGLKVYFGRIDLKAYFGGLVLVKCSVFHEPFEKSGSGW